MPASSQHLAGQEVEFPYDAYGVQKVFMCKLITALQHKQNALLEAPTGCGKTLCLLCGALAWQQHYKTVLLRQWHEAVAQHRAATAAESDRPADTIIDVDGLGQAPDGAPGDPDTAPAEDGPPKPKFPQIFYCSRTHSQIAQVIRELKNTKYKPSMAILSSRKHTCINNSVIKSGKIDEECEELSRSEFGCRFHKKGNRQKLTLQVHDIEELVRAGKAAKCCPYFAARDMATTADLVFTPYNYLVDPSIRDALGINTSNAIIILDEAHNIEDMARESGSLDVSLATLEEVYLALTHAKELVSQKEPYQALHAGMGSLLQWLRRMVTSPEHMRAGDGGTRRRATFMRAQDIQAQLAEAGLDCESCRVLHRHYKAAKEYENSKDAAFANDGDTAQQAVPEDMTVPGAGGKALGVLSQLLNVLLLLHGVRGVVEGKPGQDCSVDYRLVVECLADVPAGALRLTSGGDQASEDGHLVALGIWCMNPAVAFRSLSEGSHSVVLASGTLAPLTSFASELGTEFKTTLEGRHVVDMAKQVWAGVVSCGPSGCGIENTFKQKSNTNMQDQIAQALIELASTVPAGMLVFMPSYSYLEQLEKRWKNEGLWDQLDRIKPIIKEPREAGSGFEQAMAKHKAAVAQGKGSLLMAVCRGKASEGIDFRDDQARAVVVLGIPYPAAKDPKVVLKKSYNDIRVRSAQTHRGPPAPGTQQPPNCSPPDQPLTGDRWYELQAFRALNQAVGRCIRHKYDYGAVILMDVRFKRPEYKSKLPAWVRNSVKDYSTFLEAQSSLAQFYANIRDSPPAQPSDVTPAAPDTCPTTAATTQPGCNENTNANTSASHTVSDWDRFCGRDQYYRPSTTPAAKPVSDMPQQHAAAGCTQHTQPVTVQYSEQQHHHSSSSAPQYQAPQSSSAYHTGVGPPASSPWAQSTWSQQQQQAQHSSTPSFYPAGTQLPTSCSPAPVYQGWRAPPRGSFSLVSPGPDQAHGTPGQTQPHQHATASQHTTQSVQVSYQQQQTGLHTQAMSSTQPSSSPWPPASQQLPGYGWGRPAQQQHTQHAQHTPASWQDTTQRHSTPQPKAQAATWGRGACAQQHPVVAQTHPTPAQPSPQQSSFTFAQPQAPSGPPAGIWGATQSTWGSASGTPTGQHQQWSTPLHTHHQHHAQAHLPAPQQAGATHQYAPQQMCATTPVPSPQQPWQWTDGNVTASTSPTTQACGVRNPGDASAWSVLMQSGGAAMNNTAPESPWGTPSVRKRGHDSI